MNYKETASKIIELVGGCENIKSHTHCMTRLRFVLKDNSIAQEALLNEMVEVQGVVNKAGQYQIIIGAQVDELYKEVNQQCPIIEETESDKSKNEEETLFSKILGYVSGSIAPALSVLIAAGFTSALTTLLTQFGILSTDSSTYLFLNQLANLGFTYLPVMVAFGAAKRLKTNEYLAGFIILVLCSTSISGVEGLSFFGINLMTVKYASNIVPALFMVPVMAFVDKKITRFIPEVAKAALKPFILCLVTFTITVLVLGPIGAIIGNALGSFCIWISNFGVISMAILSIFHPILVMFGTHTVLSPIFMNETAMFGYSLLAVKALTGNFAMAGAALAVGLKAKKDVNKSSGITSGITALLSVTEPALYGTLLRLKKPFIGALIGAGLSGIFLGIFAVKSYAPGQATLFTMALYKGGDSMSNFYYACLCAVLAIVFGFIATWIIGFDED